MAKEYIEREALMNFPIRIDHYDKEHGNEHFVLGIETVLEYAENLPAADVVKVRHGMWKHSKEVFSTGRIYHRWTCSLCGRTIVRRFKEEIEDLPYCHCGAKMDGRDD